MAKWYEIKAAAPVAQGEAQKPAELLIYGNIGDRWDENGVIAADLVREMRTVDEAAEYLDLAEHVMGEGWVSAERFRFGASGLLGSLEATIAGEIPAPGQPGY